MEEQPTLDDYTAILVQQRNDALNREVNLAAELAAAKREIARLRAFHEQT